MLLYILLSRSCVRASRNTTTSLVLLVAVVPWVLVMVANHVRGFALSGSACGALALVPAFVVVANTWLVASLTNEAAIDALAAKRYRYQKP